MIAKIHLGGKEIIDNVHVYNTFFKRLHGLMFKKVFPRGGVLLVPCKQIHSFFMYFAIDVVFLDKEGYVIHVLHCFQPGKVSKLFKNSHQVLELPSGAITKHGIKEGNILQIIRETSR